MNNAVPQGGEFLAADWPRIAELTVPELVDYRATRQPNSMALSAFSSRGHRVRLTYAQLAIRMKHMRNSLNACGIGPGDHVMLLVDNDAALEGVLTALGCYALGAAIVPANTRLGDEELRHAFDLVEPVAVVAREEDAIRARRLWPAARLLMPGGEGAESWPDPETCRSADPGLPGPGRETLSALLFTSGTTSRPKAVMHCHRSQMATGYAIAGALGLRADDVYQGGWPIFTSSVLNIACMGAWVAGASLVLESQSATTADRLRLAENEGATVYHGVTAPLNFLFEEFAKGGYDLSRIRRICYGGAVMPPEIIHGMKRLLPGADQIHIWAMTETGPAGSFLPPEFSESKAGSIGAAQPGCQLRIVGEDGSEADVGEPGELQFAGDSAALGYYRNPEATAATFVDGWVRSGDLAQVDADGHIFFLDRAKDIINRGGLKIASAAVESAILRHPAVFEVAVIAVPHAKLGEDIAACVVPRAGAAIDLEELAAHARGILADFQTPRHWLLLDGLPRNPMSKVLKRELRETVIAAEASGELRHIRPTAG